MTENRSMKTISILLIITNIVVVLCLCLVAVLVLAGFGTLIYLINYSPDFSSNTPAMTVNVNQSAPDFELVNVDGKTFSLKQFSGHPVLLNFWATWCGPCKEEMPLLVERYQQYQPDLVVLAVDEGESLSDVKKFLAENALPFIILLDESQEIGDLYGIYGYPTTFFIDVSGIVQAVEVGSMDISIIDQDLLLVGVP